MYRYFYVHKCYSNSFTFLPSIYLAVQVKDCLIQQMVRFSEYNGIFVPSQVIEAGRECFGLVGKLRDFIHHKKANVKVLLGMVQRVAPPRRQTLPPLDVSYFCDLLL